MQRGLENSPLLTDYRNQIKTARVASLLVKAAARSQVLANGQVLIAPTLHGYGYDPAITNGGNYQAIISIERGV